NAKGISQSHHKNQRDKRSLMPRAYRTPKPSQPKRDRIPKASLTKARSHSPANDFRRASFALSNKPLPIIDRILKQTLAKSHFSTNPNKIALPNQP
ncbi:MAG: hypothetical protein HC903_18045, partial [Methylacidiphilales bacterium]|nr:hypothetical protein [Candidatus Methylacidiphilales bacterium]